MTAMESVVAGGEGVATTARDELVELVIEASTSFETDRDRARCCIQRAAQLARDKKVARPRAGATAFRGGLATWQMKKLTAYIEANLGDKIRIVELASIVGLSPGYFFRAFKLSFGLSPHTYIMRQRILRAQVLVATSNAPLSRIAIDCGLADQAHFSRVFRRLVGVTPALWRRAEGVRNQVDRAGTTGSARRHCI